MLRMPETWNPFDFWENLALNELVSWAFILFGCFVLFVYVLKRAEGLAHRRRRRKWRG